jgi:membrane protein YdbS with pleckstrin-like domain
LGLGLGAEGGGAVVVVVVAVVVVVVAAVVVLVAAPLGRFRKAQMAPSESARAIRAPPWRTPPVVHL